MSRYMTASDLGVHYSGPIDCAKQIIKAEGLGILVRTPGKIYKNIYKIYKEMYKYTRKCAKYAIIYKIYNESAKWPPFLGPFMASQH